LHTTPGIPQHMHPVVALVTAGVEMDVLGLGYSEYNDAQRKAVVHAHPRTPRFKEDIIQAFYDGNKPSRRRPSATPTPMFSPIRTGTSTGSIPAA
jgi:hypothetical protein